MSNLNPVQQWNLTNLRPLERHFGKLVIYRVTRTQMGLPMPHRVNREFQRKAAALSYLNTLVLDLGIADATLKTIPVEAR